MKQDEINSILKESCFSIICSLEKTENKWQLFDCNGEKIGTPDINSKLSPLMFNHYKDLTEKDFFKDESRVWALIGIDTDKSIVWLQVGRSKNRTNMLSSDVRVDVNDFLTSDGSKGKYGKYRSVYKKIVFLEVKIREYLQADDIFYKTFGVVSEENEFAPAYHCLRAAYVEGKLAADKKALMYRTSTLDGYFYEVLKQK